ncbi:hypothetical protein CN998_02725, partial [Bacillus cereus]
SIWTAHLHNSRKRKSKAFIFAMLNNNFENPPKRKWHFFVVFFRLLVQLKYSVSSIDLQFVFCP